MTHDLCIENVYDDVPDEPGFNINSHLQEAFYQQYKERLKVMELAVELRLQSMKEEAAKHAMKNG